MLIRIETGLRGVLALAAAAGVSLIAQSAQAAPHTHDGFHLQLGTGLGYANASVDEAAGGGSISGLSIPINVLLGGTVGSVAIGGGFFTDYVPSPSFEAGNGQSVVNRCIDVPDRNRRIR